MSPKEVTVDVAQLLQLFKPRNWKEVTLEISDGEGEFADTIESPLSLDLNLVVAYWGHKDGGTIIETEFGFYSITEPYDEIKAAFN